MVHPIIEIESILRKAVKPKTVSETKLRAVMPLFYALGQQSPTDALALLNAFGAMGDIPNSTRGDDAFPAVCCGMLCMGIWANMGWRAPFELGCEWEREFDDEGQMIDRLRPTFEHDEGKLRSGMERIGPLRDGARGLLRIYFADVGKYWSYVHCANSEARAAKEAERFRKEFHMHPWSRATQGCYDVRNPRTALAKMKSPLLAMAEAEAIKISVEEPKEEPSSLRPRRGL